MATRAPFSGGSVQAIGPAQPSTTERLAEVERLLFARKPWPAFLLVGSDTDEWENCPHVAKDALEWMATSAVGLLDIASVGPLTPVCQAFKSLIEAAAGAVEAEEKLRELISWCAFIIGVFVKLGKTGGALSDMPVRTCLQDFESTANRLAKRAQALATKRKCTALLCYRKDTTGVASFEDKLRKIWADIGVLAVLDVRETQRRLLPLRLEPVAAVPIGALSLPDSYVERTCMVEEVVCALTACGAASHPHMLLGMGGGGKTVLASSVVRHEDVRKHFRQGIFWIRVGQGGKDQLHALFQGLARDVGAAPTDTPHGIPPDGFSNLDAVVQHLSAVAPSSSPRLVVLDDVWEREVVDTVLPMGLVVLVTTRDESVVGVPGRTRTDVGDMTEDEVVELLGRASGSVGSPGADVTAAIRQVGRDCGLLPLALAIAGSMPVVKGRGSSAQAWVQLHKHLANKGDMLLAKGGTKTSLHRVLDASFDQLGTRKQKMFLRMAVLPKGVVAPEDMLLNLWEVEGVEETRDEARGLAGRSLLQVVGSGGYRMHDLLLDFARDRIKPAPLEMAASCQARYLGRLDVVRGYAGEDEKKDGFYSLIALWRSVEELSGNALLQGETYLGSLLVLAEDESNDAAYAHWAVGRLFELQGKYTEAEPLYLRSIDITEKTLGCDHHKVAVSLNNLAGLFMEQRKYAEAEPLYLRSKDIIEKTMGREHPSMAAMLGNLAGLYRAQGKYAEARTLFRETIDIQEKTLGPDHPFTATSLNNLAILLKAQGKYPEAETLFLRSIEITEKTLGRDHHEVAVTLNNLAGSFQEHGKYEEAEPLILRAMGIHEKTLGSDHPEEAKTLARLASLFMAQGKYTEAEPVYLRAIEIKEKTLGPDHQKLAKPLNNLAMLLKAQGRYAEAETVFLRAIDIKETRLGPDHPSTASTLGNLAGLCQAQGRHNQAIKLFERALSIRMQKLGAEHTRTKDTRQALDFARKQVGQIE